MNEQNLTRLHIHFNGTLNQFFHIRTDVKNSEENEYEFANMDKEFKVIHASIGEMLLQLLLLF